MKNYWNCESVIDADANSMEYTFDTSAYISDLTKRLRKVEDDIAEEVILDWLRGRGYVVLGPDQALGVDAEYYQEAGKIAAQLGIAKDDLAETIAAVAKFSHLIPNLDISDHQWQAMMRWFREFMKAFGGFKND